MISGSEAWLLDFTVRGRPVTQGSMKAIPVYDKHGRFLRTYMKPSADGLMPWRKDVGSAALIARGKARLPIFDCAMRLDLLFVLPRLKKHKDRCCTPDDASLRPDLSKMLRAVEDALTGVLVDDDKRFTAESVRKRIAVPGESAAVRIRIARDGDVG